MRGTKASWHSDFVTELVAVTAHAKYSSIVGSTCCSCADVKVVYVVSHNSTTLTAMLVLGHVGTLATTPAVTAATITTVADNVLVP
jgi:hypothetical protein